MPLRRLGVVLAALPWLMLANAYNTIMLFAAFFVLRQFGQGLMPLRTTRLTVTLIKPGKAALISLGLPHMMLFPLLALSLEDYLIGGAWVIYGCFVLFILLPVMDVYA